MKRKSKGNIVQRKRKKNSSHMREL